MATRGPRGDISAESILRAADRLLVEHGRIEGISLRRVAAEVGVAVNALYTYFPSLDAIWHDLADERLGRLDPEQLLERECPHCALLELADRAITVVSSPGTVSLLRRGPVLGRCSFVLSETIMTLTEPGSLDPRDAHDLVVGWFFGSAVLEGEGWTSGTDAIRDADPLQDFPRIAGRSAPDRRQQAEALLRGLGLPCSAPPRLTSPLPTPKGPPPMKHVPYLDSEEGLSPKTSHPDYVAVAPEWFWSTDDPRAPFGSDDGHDAYTTLLDHFIEGGGDEHVPGCVANLIVDWALVPEEIWDSSTAEITAWLNADENHCRFLHGEVDAYIAAACGQFKISGWIHPALRFWAERALMLFEHVLAPWEQRAFGSDPGSDAEKIAASRDVIAAAPEPPEEMQLPMYAGE